MRASPCVLGVLLAVLLAVAGTARSQPQAPAGSGTPQARAAAGSPDAGGYVARAAIADMFEIEASTLALERSGNERVKRFAGMMVDDHTGMAADLKRAVQEAKSPIKVPGELDDAHRRMLDQLREARGEEFDRLYLRMQLKGHEDALALHSSYARDGDHAELRSVAATATPLVERHLVQLRMIAEP